MARINKGNKMDKERKGRNDKNQEMKIKFDKKLKKGGKWREAMHARENGPVRIFVSGFDGLVQVFVYKKYVLKFYIRQI